jgi:hypothetical protein
MRKSLNIKGVGEVNLTKPRSFAAISDLNVDWWAAQSGGSHSTLSRLVAAAIGISWDHHRNELSAPVYDVARGNIAAFGGEMLDFLLKRGAVPASIYNKRELVNELWDLLPKEAEVEATADSFPEEDGVAGSGSVANSEGVGAGA